MAKTKTLKITQVKSGIGYKQKAKATLEALGLRKIHQTVEHQDTPVIRKPKASNVAFAFCL